MIVFESLTVGATVIGLSSSVYETAQFTAKTAIITVEDEPIRYRIDGTAPGDGHEGIENDVMELCTIEEIRNFRAVRSGASDSAIKVTYQ